ncbi:hypothetical protein E3P81_04048 [Wallemia ichthyophaga]|nr:hypothetical protein E3P97_04057 [Wallemia ichthyophaga]TIB27639.1 hypothetical protein E3P85_04146 [Wallemia ichthyophaga]TIB43182.1 hypothetical protein E3P82_04058 [Wallemia ichthyophaga]TIB45405.1 hypothetical protein E3P81_04048 [Wallemia ichthyophaga]TIB47311.1 hypothetical protein E3P80_04062 [Wallemia ichthyophaga]
MAGEKLTTNWRRSVQSTVGTQVPDIADISYKRPSMPYPADLFDGTGRKSFNDSASTSVADVMPIVVRTKTAPTEEELECFLIVPV